MIRCIALCSVLMLKEWGWRCVEADDGTTAVAAVEKNSYDAVLMDVRMAKMDGREAFTRIHARYPSLPVIIMTAYSSVDDAVEVIQQGAHDYLTKPLDFDRLRLALMRAVDHHQVVSSKQQKEPGSLKLETTIIGASPPMLELLEMVGYVAPTEATVLIYGESGTGKELVAEALHNNSERGNSHLSRSTVQLLPKIYWNPNCLVMKKVPLPGLKNGGKASLFRRTAGRLFLDEIGETSQAMQVKLLRVLQEQELQRVGGEETISVDVRIIAATNRESGGGGCQQ